MLLATTLLWALNFTVSKYILEHGLRPLAYSGVRYSAAALVFVAITFPWERSLRIAKRDWPLVAIAIALLLGNQLSFVYALDFTTAATTALLFGTLPIWTALISRLVGIERLGNRFWIAVFLSCCSARTSSRTRTSAGERSSGSASSSPFSARSCSRTCSGSRPSTASAPRA